tara:strand:- start:357 stop:608 length:252 start_codon:yes stop_codon:yes gene_type:complete
MAKVITEKAQEQAQADATKMVEIKHTRTMQSPAGKDIEVLDWTETKSVDEAISQCETHKANLEAKLAECESEMADYVAIRDAE